MKKPLKISIIATTILLAILILMRSTCTGLWTERVFKIPSDFLSFSEMGKSKPDDYTKCVYTGFSEMINSWK